MAHPDRAVILTALGVEYQAVQAHLLDLQEEVHPQGTVYERGRFVAGSRTWDVLLGEIGPGNDGAAQECERAIAYFDPRVALFVGVAGGLKDVSLGDVVAATKVYDYTSGKADITFKPRPLVGESTYGLIQRALAERRKDDWLVRLGDQRPDPSPTVHVKPIAAGEQVVSSTSSDTYTLIRTQYGDAVAVEMEGYGFLRAVHANAQVGALIIRGISDLIDGKAEADSSGSQLKVARHAAAFAFEILAKLDDNGLPPKFPTGSVSMVGPEVGPSSGIGANLRLDSVTADFTGRTEELESLAVRLRSGTDSSVPTLCGIAGMAGVGKSTLAIQAAHKVQAAYPDGCYCINLQAADGSPQDPSVTLDALIRAFDGHTPERVEERAGHYQALLEGKRVLIVFDNAHSATSVRDVLPGSAACAAIVTSRRRIGTIPGLAYMTLNPMCVEEALALLGALVGNKRLSSDPEAGYRIVAACGNLPLAIRIAAGLLNTREHWTLARLADDLAEERRRLKRLNLEDLSVRASLEVSYRELEEHDRHVFDYLGIFIGADFHAGALATIMTVSDDDAREGLERLVDAQLLSAVVSDPQSRQPFSEDRFYFHDLVRLFAQSHFERKPQAEQNRA